MGPPAAHSITHGRAGKALLEFVVGRTEAKNQKGKTWHSLKRTREKMLLA